MRLVIFVALLGACCASGCPGLGAAAAPRGRVRGGRMLPRSSIQALAMSKRSSLTERVGSLAGQTLPSIVAVCAPSGPKPGSQATEIWRSVVARGASVVGFDGVEHQSDHH